MCRESESMRSCKKSEQQHRCSRARRSRVHLLPSSSPPACASCRTWSNLGTTTSTSSLHHPTHHTDSHNAARKSLADAANIPYSPPLSSPRTHRRSPYQQLLPTPPSAWSYSQTRQNAAHRSSTRRDALTGSTARRTATTTTATSGAQVMESAHWVCEHWSRSAHSELRGDLRRA